MSFVQVPWLARTVQIDECCVWCEFVLWTGWTGGDISRVLEILMGFPMGFGHIHKYSRDRKVAEVW